MEHSLKRVKDLINEKGIILLHTIGSVDPPGPVATIHTKIYFSWRHCA